MAGRGRRAWLPAVGFESYSVPLVDGIAPPARGSRRDRHPQRARERLEHRLGLVVRVLAAQVVDVQRHQRVVDEALEELVREVDVERADQRARERHVELEARAAGEVDDDARQRLVERHVGVAVAREPLLSPSACATAWPSVMPMSSTVWCASMCRSPLARDDEVDHARAARSGRACGRGTARRSRARRGRCRRGRPRRRSASPRCCARPRARREGMEAALIVELFAAPRAARRSRAACRR